MDMQANWRQPTPQENKSLTGCPNCRCISQEKINVKRPAWKIRTTFAKPHFSLLAHKNVTCKETILLSAKTKIMAATLALKMLNFYLVSSSLYTFRVYSQVFIILFTEDTSLHKIKDDCRVRLVWKASLLVSFNTSGTNTAVWMQ